MGCACLLFLDAISAGVVCGTVMANDVDVVYAVTAIKQTNKREQQ